MERAPVIHGRRQLPCITGLLQLYGRPGESFPETFQLIQNGQYKKRKGVPPTIIEDTLLASSLFAYLVRPGVLINGST